MQSVRERKPCNGKPLTTLTTLTKSDGTETPKAGAALQVARREYALVRRRRAEGAAPSEIYGPDFRRAVAEAMRWPDYRAHSYTLSRMLHLEKSAGRPKEKAFVDAAVGWLIEFDRPALPLTRLLIAAGRELGVVLQADARGTPVEAVLHAHAAWLREHFGWDDERVQRYTDLRLDQFAAGLPRATEPFIASAVSLLRDVAAGNHREPLDAA
jgi:hypothetical protein